MKVISDISYPNSNTQIMMIIKYYTHKIRLIQVISFNELQVQKIAASSH